MIGITLVEDLAVVVLTVLLPVLGALEPGRLLAIGGALVKSALILAPLAYLAWKVVPHAAAPRGPHRQRRALPAWSRWRWGSARRP